MTPWTGSGARPFPNGVYDVAANQGWVSIGIDHDIAAFAAASVRRWREQMGRPTYPTAVRITSLGQRCPTES